MSPTPDDERELGGDDLLAAEFVLGVLSLDERVRAARRLDEDRAFAHLVAAWEARLAPMSVDFAEEAPSAAVKRALDARLFASGASAPDRSGMWSSLAFWRGLAFASVLALAFLGAYLLAPPAGQPPAGDRLVASLAHEDSDVRYLAVYDPERHEIGLSHLAGERGAGEDFELWVIEGDQAPRSLGVIPAGETVRVTVGPDAPAIAAGAAFAISLEPEGGSPSGQPTGPVLALGNLTTI